MMYNRGMQEYEIIVEFSFNSRQDVFVIRFLNGDSYCLKVSDLPKKMLTRKPDFEGSRLNGDRNAILYEAGKDLRQIASHVVHSRGKML